MDDKRIAPQSRESRHKHANRATRATGKQDLQVPDNRDGYLQPNGSAACNPLRIVFISDTHGLHDKVTVPDGDVLVHCGDVSNIGKRTEVEAFLLWFSRQPHRHKLFIAGNHDWLFLKQPDVALRMIPHGVTYLQDNGVIIDGVKFWGSPWQPEFCGWAFNLPRGKALADKWATIPDDTNVLITHGPPAGILDTIRLAGLPLGCVDLAARLQQLPALRVHAFGHIHGGYGVREGDGVTFVNAAICTEAYQPTNAPTVLSPADCPLRCCPPSPTNASR